MGWRSPNLKITIITFITYNFWLQREKSKYHNMDQHVKRRKVTLNDLVINQSIKSPLPVETKGSDDGAELEAEIEGANLDAVLEDTELDAEVQTQLDAEVEEDPIIADDWLPPSVTSLESPLTFISSTYHSEIPSSVQSDLTQSVVLGVDEAGRGPVMGPMVYGVAYSPEAYLDSLKSKYGFADSKTLKEDKRRELFQMIEGDDELHKQVGWCTTTMTARDILGGMLRSSIGRGSYNLNEQAHDVTIQLIKEVIAKGVNVTQVFVDTVGPPESYARKLRGHFPGVEITVAKKADSIYPIVSTASVVAKVTRDYNLEYFNKVVLGNVKIGSGYPSDPNTTKWFNSNVDKVFGWNFGLVRFLWQTSKDSLVRADAANVVYEDKCVKADGGYQYVSLFFTQEKQKIDKLYYSLSDDLGI